MSRPTQKSIEELLVCRFVQSTSWFLALLGLLAGRQMAQPAPSGDGQGLTSGLSGWSIAQPDAREPGSSEVARGTQSSSSARNAGLVGLRQLPTAILPPDDPSLSPYLQSASSPTRLPRDIPGRRIPAVTLMSDLALPDLASRAVALPEANTLAHINYQGRRFGRLQTAEGETWLFNPGCLLVKFEGHARVSALA